MVHCRVIRFAHVYRSITAMDRFRIGPGSGEGRESKGGPDATLLANRAGSELEARHQLALAWLPSASREGALVQSGVVDEAITRGGLGVGRA